MHTQLSCRSISHAGAQGLALWVAPANCGPFASAELQLLGRSSGTSRVAAALCHGSWHRACSTSTAGQCCWLGITPIVHAGAGGIAAPDQHPLPGPWALTAPAQTPGHAVLHLWPLQCGRGRCARHHPRRVCAAGQSPAASLCGNPACWSAAFPVHGLAWSACALSLPRVSIAVHAQAGMPRTAGPGGQSTLISKSQVAALLMTGCWAVQVPFFPPVQRLEDVTPAAASTLVRAAMGPDAASVEVRVQSVRQWTMSAQVADRFLVSFRHSWQLWCRAGMCWQSVSRSAALHGSCKPCLAIPGCQKPCKQSSVDLYVCGTLQHQAWLVEPT